MLGQLGTGDLDQDRLKYFPVTTDREARDAVQRITKELDSGKRLSVRQLRRHEADLRKAREILQGYGYLSALYDRDKCSEKLNEAIGLKEASLRHWQNFGLGIAGLLTTICIAAFCQHRANKPPANPSQPSTNIAPTTSTPVLLSPSAPKTTPSAAPSLSATIQSVP